MRRQLAFLAILFLHACGDETTTRTPNVILITMDTTRADRLGSYGYPAPLTPHLDELAARGVRFERAYSTNPVTLPSHATILTGTYPTYHGIRDNGFYRLDEINLTWAESLKAQGYRTGAILGAAVLRDIFGLDQGFDHYDDDLVSLGDSSNPYSSRDGATVTDRSLDWLRQSLASETPVFLWAHYFDPHLPWNPPESSLQQVDPNASHPKYDASIAYMDQQIGRLLRGLKSWDALEHTIVVAVADHGEALGDHGEETHGLFIYDEVMRVPCIMAGPGIPRRMTSESVIRTADLLPTVLELLGLDSPFHTQGVSLLPELEDRETIVKDAYMETYHPENLYGWSWLEGLRAGDGSLKYIDAPSPELYDLSQDPNELVNHIESRSDEARELARRLIAVRSDTPEEGPRATALEPSSEMRGALEALGYAIERTETDVRGPDVKTSVALFEHRAAGMRALAIGDFEKAKTELNLFLDGVPKKGFGYELLGTASLAEADVLRSSGETAAATDALERACELFHKAVAEMPGSVPSREKLASILQELDRDEEMLIQIRAILEQDPESLSARLLAANHHYEKRQFEKASSYLEGLSFDMRQGGPDLGTARRMGLMKAVCQIEVGSFQEAEQALDAIGQAAPDWIDPIYWRGVLAYRQDDAKRAKSLLLRFLSKGGSRKLQTRAKRLLNRIDR